MKLKWFLAGLVCVLMAIDWARLRMEQIEMTGVTMSSLELAHRQAKTVNSCKQTLEEVKEMLQVAELRAQVAIYSRAHALDLFTRSKRGDPEAIALLEDLGLAYPQKPSFFPQEAKAIKSNAAIGIGGP